MTAMRATRLGFLGAFLLAGCGGDTVQAPPPVDARLSFQASWGGHGAGAGQFYQPTAIATGSDGSVYVLDNQNTRVQKFTNDGVFVRSWGDTTLPRLSPLLRGIAVSRDRVYVSDLGTAATYVYTTDGTYLATWDYISMDSGLAVDPDGNVILSGYQVLKRDYITDLLGPYVWRLDPEGTSLARWTLPVLQVTVDSQGYIYGVVTKYKGEEPRGLVFKFTPQGVYMGRFGTPDTLSVYDAVAVNSEGDVFVANRPNSSIIRFAADGRLLASWTDLGSEGFFGWPAGLAMDAADNLFVTDLQKDLVSKWSGASPAP
jgi:DNA-binding beta-propeller fold protein YncE